MADHGDPKWRLILHTVHGNEIDCQELRIKILVVILDPDLECHLLTFNRLLVVFCHILSATGE